MNKELNKTSLKIREALSNGLTQDDISAEIGICRKTLYHRLKLDNWKKSEILLIDSKF